ncbi:aldo/keto reductase [Parenemella sanctibonifatiensis]|uniref:Aldo/keto reductase n=1 Tax=Parenemella sanctibonifatiensis TaxID=2016505 RepID=A0A255E054_9ACTN|nr:aldo/keto reductase [Parenemella sanctibonifatiensis]OYN84710.1 aldo/keto reductase [Parenemella sanctibonifatiensis]
MQYTTLGRTGVTVSRLVLGTMNFGPETSEKDSFAIMDSAIESGINFFDTANRYGGPGHAGRTEEIVGRWLKSSGKRDNVVLATKVYGGMSEDPNATGVSAKNIRVEVEQSLRRLGTDYIDLYQMHHIDRSVPWEELWQAMDQLVTAGKVLYVGSSNFAGWHLAQANEAARHRGTTLGLVSEQSKYSLLTRDIELEVLPAARAYGIGVISWSPLAGGLLGGAVAKAKEGRRARADQERVAQLEPQLTAWEDLCAELGHAPGDAALAWHLTREGVTGPIIGPRTMDQLDGARRALDIELDEATQARIDEIFPGPGGPAPEAYAW